MDRDLKYSCRLPHFTWRNIAKENGDCSIKGEVVHLAFKLVKTFLLCHKNIV
jgi:hypothetical protein